MTTARSHADVPATQVVRCLLESLENGDVDLAMEMLDDSVVYSNVSLPTLRSRAAVDRAFRAAMGPMSFRGLVGAVLPVARRSWPTEPRRMIAEDTVARA